MRTGMRGLTIVELMVVLIVLGIVLALAAPSFTEAIRSSRLTTQVNELVAALQMARAEAVRRNKTVQYCADPDKAKWTVAIKGEDDALREGVIGPDIGLEAHCVDFGSDGIAYDPDTGSVVTDAKHEVRLAGTSPRIVYINVASISAYAPK
jgi:prepilin-type N-terminal cleavage/methylation domain